MFTYILKVGNTDKKNVQHCIFYFQIVVDN